MKFPELFHDSPIFPREWFHFSILRWWESSVVSSGYLAPFDQVTEELRAKMEIAAKPKEEVEEVPGGLGLVRLGKRLMDEK